MAPGQGQFSAMHKVLSELGECFGYNLYEAEVRWFGHQRVGTYGRRCVVAANKIGFARDLLMRHERYKGFLDANLADCDCDCGIVSRWIVQLSGLSAKVSEHKY